MKIRTSSCLPSSLRTAAFRLVDGQDRRGLVYQRRREIMTWRLLRQDPLAAGSGQTPRGRIATLRQLKALDPN